MLTKRQNLLETIHGGNPDRFVKQFEAFAIVANRPTNGGRPALGGKPEIDEWGVWSQWFEGQPGSFPLHDDEHLLIKDIEHWQDYVTPPDLKAFPEAAWEPFIAAAEAVDRNEQFCTFFHAPGILERCNNMCRLEEVMINLYEYPDEMHDLIECITEFELTLAEMVCERIHPDALFHHDDWGSQISTFMAPDMFEEFILEPGKRVYDYYHEHGVEVIAHHSDSYAATLVPFMIEMGINVWQGAITTNNIPEIIKEYGPQLTIMGGIDSGIVDREDWTPEKIEEVVREQCTTCGKLYFIPNATRGLSGSIYPGVYDCIDEKIDMMSAEMF